MSATQENRSPNRSLVDYRREIEDRLARVRRRLRGQLIMEGLAWAIGCAVALALLSLLWDRLAKPDVTVRTTLLLIGLAIIAFVTARRLYPPLLLRLDDLDLAELLERRQQGLGQKLTNVLLLPQLQQQDPSASAVMIQAAVQEDFQSLQSVDLNSTFDEKRRRNFWVLLAAVLVPVALFCLVNPAMASLWARRWFAGAEIRWPQKNYLSIAGLDDADRISVPRGESYLLQVDAQPRFSHMDGYWKLNGRGSSLIVEGKIPPESVIPESVTLNLKLADGTDRQGTLTYYPGGKFRYELPPLFEAAEMTVRGGDDWFGPLRIEPIDRPAVEGLTVTAIVPGRTDPEVYRADEAQKQLLFLPGTRLQLELVSSQPLSSAIAAVSGSDVKRPLEMTSSEHYRLPWDLEEPVTFEFQLSGKSGLESKPYFVSFGILNDRAPRLTLRSSGVGRRITPVARIPLHLRAIDDFGIGQIAVELEETHLVDSKPVTSTQSPLSEKFELSDGAKLPLDVNREPTVGIGEYSLNPGTSVRIRGNASDACVLGAQSAESRWLAFQVVTAEELFYEILTRQREQRARFAKALETAKAQKDSLVVAATGAEVSQITRTHQALTRQVWQVAGQLDATYKEMTLNDLGTTAGRELLLTSVIQPMKELHDRPLAEHLKALSSLIAADKIDEDRREAAIESQGQNIQQMQRILDQMAQWESFVDVVNQLRHVIDSQNKIRDSTEQMQKQQIKDVFDE